MEQINNKMLESLLLYSKNAGWRYTLWSEKETGKQGTSGGARNFAELEKYSPAGEDFFMDIYFNINNPVGSFIENLKEYTNEFNIDDHVENWIPSRGKEGCPGSIKALVEDAEAIQKMLENLLELLSEKGSSLL